MTIQILMLLSVDYNITGNWLQINVRNSLSIEVRTLERAQCFLELYCPKIGAILSGTGTGAKCSVNNVATILQSHSRGDSEYIYIVDFFHKHGPITGVILYNVDLKYEQHCKKEHTTYAWMK